MNVDVTLIEGSGGIFDIKLDDELVYSKHQTGEFPDEATIVSKLEPEFR